MGYLFSRMLPGLSLIIPMYLVIRALGLLDTLPGLILPYTALTLPFTIWILRSYFMTIPRELEDAARVDRCNWLNMMWRVFLPVAAPGLIASAMFSFMAAWKEFLFALIFSSSMAAKTVPVIVAEFNDPQVVPRTIMTASGVVAVIPPLILAVIFQRLIIQGLVAGSVKG
jgi:multiple sugar transport system permease protein